MCCSQGVCCGSSKAGCTTTMVCKILLVVGGLNWGVLGLGMLLGHMGDWNVVHMVLGSMPVAEGVVYVLVGVAAMMKLFHCKCKKCMCTTDTHGKMGGGM